MLKTIEGPAFAFFLCIFLKTTRCSRMDHAGVCDESHRPCNMFSCMQSRHKPDGKKSQKLREAPLHQKKFPMRK